MKALAIACILLMPCVLWADRLPDAPSAQVVPSRSFDSDVSLAPPPPPTIRSGEGLNGAFGLATSMLFSSSIANAEMIARCRPDFCNAVPSSLRSRPALYGIGLPADVGVTYLAYRLKKGGHRWWFVPMAVIAAGNVIYSLHAAQYSK